MGEVYRARDTRLNRIVALKILPASSSSDEVRRQRLQREARAISALQHPNICTLYDVGQQDGIDFLVMELLEGETLASRLEKSKLSLDQVLTYGIEIADALDAARHRGIIHRDLKTCGRISHLAMSQMHFWSCSRTAVLPGRQEMILLWGLPGDRPLAAVRDVLRELEEPFFFLDQGAGACDS